MGPPKAAQLGRVDILFRIGELVMVPVMGSPPKRPLLAARSAPEGQNELKETTGLIGAMGEITVVSPRDGEHAGVIHEKAHADGRPADTGKNGQDADHVDTEEGDASAPIEPLIHREFGFALFVVFFLGLGDRMVYRWIESNFKTRH